MTEDDARLWLEDNLDVSRETIEKLDVFRGMLAVENANQNLVSEKSLAEIWSRHIVDSAQLLLEAGRNGGTWLDLGTGAGFPGIVIAILCDAPIVLVESRRKRVEFLQDVAAEISLPHVIVKHTRVEALKTEKFDVISARAFAPLAKTLPLAHRFADSGTIWLLPKGQSAESELESVRGSWHGVFHVKRSVTDKDAGIIVATNIRRAGSA